MNTTAASVNFDLLSNSFKNKRTRTGATLREVAMSIGVSATSLSRLENWDEGQPGFDLATVSAVAKWLGGTASDYLIIGQARHADPMLRVGHLTEVVALYLSNDQSVSSYQAQRLTAIVGLLYDMARGAK